MTPDEFGQLITWATIGVGAAIGVFVVRKRGVIWRMVGCAVGAIVGFLALAVFFAVVLNL